MKLIVLALAAIFFVVCTVSAIATGRPGIAASLYALAAGALLAFIWPSKP